MSRGWPTGWRRAIRHDPLGTLGVPLAMVLAAFLVRHAVGHGMANGVDTPFHLARSQFGLRNLFLHGRTDGWNPMFAMGAQSFLVYGPGVAIVFAVGKVATLGLVADDTLFTWLTALAYVATVPAVSFLGRSLGLERRAANLLGVLALAINCNFGLGFQGTYYWGLVPHQFALTPLCLAVGATVRLWRDGSRRWVLLSGASWAALAVTHLQSAMAAALLVAVLAPGVVWRYRPNRAVLLRVVKAAAIAAGLGAFWFVPFAALSGPRGVVATWDTPTFGDRAFQVAHGTELFISQPVLAAIACLAAGFTLVRIAQRRWLAASVFAGPFALWAFTHWVFTRFYANASPGSSQSLADIARLLANRTLPYIGIFILLPLAAALGWLAQRTGAVAGLAMLGVAVTLVTAAYTNLTWEVRLKSSSPDAVAAATALHELVPEHGRFLFYHVDASTELSFDIGHPGVWLAQQSGRATANGYGSETVTRFATNISHEFAGLPPDEARHWLEIMRVSHVVTPNAEAFDAVSAIDGTTLVWQSGSMAIFQVDDRPDRPGAAAPVSADGPIDITVVEQTDESLVFDYRAAQTVHAVVGIAAFEKWHLVVNGAARSFAIDPHSDDGLIATDLSDNGRVELHYRDSAADFAGRIISAASFIGVLVWVLTARRRRRTATLPT